MRRVVPFLHTHTAEGLVHNMVKPVSKLLLASPRTLTALPKIKAKFSASQKTNKPPTLLHLPRSRECQMPYNTESLAMYLV